MMEDDETLSGTPGKPPLLDRPLLEAGLVFAAFWLGAYLPSPGPGYGAAMAEPLYHLGMAAHLLPKALLLLFLMARRDGLEAFGGIGRLRPADASGAVFVAAGAFCLVLLPSALFATLSSLGLGSMPVNPILAAVGKPQVSPLLLVPAVVLDCLCIGYTEELFFRVYLPRRLAQAGLAQSKAALATVVLFASAHGAQGGLGLGMAALLGAWFIWCRLRGARLHELALGHGLYDAVVILATLYLRG